MPLILNIETSGSICSVCMARDGRLIDFREDKQPNSHARVLTVLIDELFKKNNLALSDVDAIAVSAGPGSYTGLRIGVSTAKGLCYALDKPLIAVPTLLSLAMEICKKTSRLSRVYMPVIDARRLDVYTAVFDASGTELFKTERVTLNSSLVEKLSSYNELYVGGNAINKFREVFNTGNFHYVEGIDCDSRLMTDISHRKYRSAEFEDLGYFEPVYVNQFMPGGGNQ